MSEETVSKFRRRYPPLPPPKPKPKPKKLKTTKVVYDTDVIGNNETLLNFLSKEKNKKARDYLFKGYKVGKAAKLAVLHINTVSKIKKLMSQNA
jgi:hypothetical protein